MQRLRTSLLALVLLALAPLTAAAQTTTACDQKTDPLFVLPPDAPGAEYGFGYPTSAFPDVTLFRLRIYDADQPTTAPALSTQDVTRAATTYLGSSVSTGLGCYALPVIPVSQIPRGKRLTMTVQAVGAISDLNALESGRSTAPFGSRLPAAAAPQRKP